MRTAILDQICDDLEGQCLHNLDDMIEEHELQELTLEEHQYVDSKVFCCTTCNWWTSASDCHDSENDEWVCGQCKDEETGEDQE